MSKGTLITLVPPPPPEEGAVYPEVVAAIELALEAAKDGRIIGVALACALTDSETATAYALGGGSVSALFYASANLSRRLMEHDE